jgi:hypothetical protein
MRTGALVPVASFAGLAVVTGAVACATQATPSAVGINLPSSGVGPFQALTQMQVEPADVAPFVCLTLGESSNEPSVLPQTTDGSTPALFLYMDAQRQGVNGIVRTRSDDGVSFYGDSADLANNPSHHPPFVLKPTLSWEGMAVTGPSALRVGSEIWLYYAGQGGIGLAKSTDGLTFTKTGSPVLAVDPSATWENGGPRAPTVAVFPDGTWHMLYAAGTSIGEATSNDGVAWTRVAGNPVLVPSTPVDPKTLPEGSMPPFDEHSVDDPLLLPRMDPSGQLQVRVLYTGYDESAADAAATLTGTIGFAARYGDAGTLTRQSIPVYVAPGSTASGPALLEWNGPTMLYVAQLDSTVMPTSVPIAAAYDPSGGSPPAVGKYPSAP